MYAESGKSLSSTLAEADVAQTFGLGDLKNVIDGIGNVMPCKIIHAKEENQTDVSDCG